MFLFYILIFRTITNYELDERDDNEVEESEISLLNEEQFLVEDEVIDLESYPKANQSFKRKIVPQTPTTNAQCKKNKNPDSELGMVLEAIKKIDENDKKSPSTPMKLFFESIEAQASDLSQTGKIELQISTLQKLLEIQTKENLI